MSITILYIVLVIGFFIVSNLNRWFLIPSIFAISFVNPVIEKLTDPSLYGRTWHDVNFNRVWPELLLTVFLLFNIRLSKIKPLSLFNVKLDTSLFFFGWFFLTLLSFFFSEYPERSGLLFILSFINPMLIFYISHDYLSSLKADNFEKEVSTIISVCLIIFFLIGVATFIMSDGISLLLTFGSGRERTNQNLWIGQMGVQSVIISIPYIILNKARYQLNSFALALFGLAAILSMSRTVFILVGIALIFIIYRKGIKAFSWKLVVPLIAIFVYLGDIAFVYIQSMSERFLGTFNASGGPNREIKVEDGRVGIFSEAMELVQNHPLFGIGQGSFYKFNDHGYSDAHNALLSITVETGIPAGIFYLLFFISFFKFPSSRTLITMKFGLFLFLIGTLTGTQLFTNSGFVTGFRACFIFFNFALFAVLGEQEMNKKLRNEIK